ncbi:hypothetical protein ACJMK2_038922 [Sinanodonta woodiana]|uniref:C-type lectin domain-containing protein n=1 Tax=Sinanodonta woodiana TaxID=1069815 RepID=A0ABD3WAF0_SINWO
MIFPMDFAVYGILSICEITYFTQAMSVIPSPPVRFPGPIASPLQSWQSAGFPGFGSLFGILALITIVTILPTFLRPRNITAAPGCPSAEYYLYSTACGRFCYRYESSACQSWSSARATCRAEGGDLLVPSECYYQFFKDNAQQNEGSCNNFWLGGSTTTPGLNYVSVRGDPIPGTFPFWNPGQPSGTGGLDSCVEMSKTHSHYLMNDGVCSVNKGSICQIFV